MPITIAAEAFIREVVKADMNLREIEQMVRWAVIQHTLARHRFNRSRTAKVLGVHRNTLARDLREMKLAGFSIPPVVRRNVRRGISSLAARRQRLSA
jgi:DNA-binding NtrC family response regulator